MTPRNYDYLVGEGLMPNEHDVRALKRCAVIGAFGAAGVPLLLAAYLARGILDEFNQADGEAASGLNNLLSSFPPRARNWIGDRLPKTGDFNDYWLHRALRQHPHHRAGRACQGDALIEIVDREYVFVDTRSSPPLHRDYEAEKRLPPTMTVFGRIDGWRRNAAPQVAHFLSQLPPIGSPSHADEAERLIDAFADARENAVATTRVNVSLAIRRALDDIAAHRENRLIKGQSDD